jgi:Aerotolerance regulator N-terminal
MFGLSFLFSAALWALPLAALPVVLHLLFKQKTPLLQFSTLRFIQVSLNQTAARKKVHRWLLLVCRMALLALLIWALAQPARRYASVMAGRANLAAAIVVDTSYSMELQDGQLTLLQKADEQIQDLLRTELRDSSVAIFRSAPGSSPTKFQPAESFRGDHWAPLQPTPSPLPLVDRVASAVNLLRQSDADRKWLIVLTDAQSKEFPRPLPAASDIRTMLIDLHPKDVRSAAITRISTDPAQLRLGMPAQVLIDLNGRRDDGRQVKLDITPADPAQSGAVAQTAPSLPMARFDAAGRAQVRAPATFEDSAWLMLTARLESSETLAWAEQRSELVHVPGRSAAAVMTVGPANPMAERMIRLALDPSEGQQAAWPIALHDGEARWDESMVVAILDQWPDEATIRQMEAFVNGGGSLVLFVQPGLEESWGSLSTWQQQELAKLLPSAPATVQSPVDAVYHASILRPADIDLTDVGDARSAEGRLVITRLVRFVGGDGHVTPIINAAPNDPESGTITGLLWRRTFEQNPQAEVYTWATSPDRSCGNLRVWDLFPPALVNAALRPSVGGESDTTMNTEIGEPLVLRAADIPASAGGAEVDIVLPDQRQVKVVPSAEKVSDTLYEFADTSQPGLYAWRWHRDDDTGGQIGWANVQLPASEARLEYRSIAEIAPPSLNVLTGNSLADLRSEMAKLEQPEPEWSVPIAIVLLLLCVEALLGSLPKGWMDWRKAGRGGVVKAAA